MRYNIENHYLYRDKLLKEIPNILHDVYDALEEKGYKAIDQMIGYFGSGDPSYITMHNNARLIIRHVNREDIFKAMLRSYLDKENQEMSDILRYVYNALEEKGYDAIDHIVEYLFYNNPAFITMRNNARNIIQHVNRDDIFEVLLRSYLGKPKEENKT